MMCDSSKWHHFPYIFRCAKYGMRFVLVVTNSTAATTPTTLEVASATEAGAMKVIMMMKMSMLGMLIVQMIVGYAGEVGNDWPGAVQRPQYTK